MAKMTPAERAYSERLLQAGAAVADFTKGLIPAESQSKVADFATILLAAHAIVLGFSISLGNDRDEVITKAQEGLPRMVDAISGNKRFDA